MSDRESGDDQPQGQMKIARMIMVNTPGRQCEIDVRPVVGPVEYKKLMESCNGKPTHKVFVRNTAPKKERTGNDNVFDKVQYWYPEGQEPPPEQELATKMLQIQSKRFYIDVKQNRRGRFIKVAEIGVDGRRSQIYLALSTAAEFRDYLSTFSDYYSSLGPPNSENVPEDGKLKSETMIKDNRRYYLDLKENARGRFLRVSQTITRGGPRSQIAIPAQGMIEFRDALTDLLEEYGTEDGGFKGKLPEGMHMRVENKIFYFDIGQNNRGVYMRISEVKTNFRTAITVPERSWVRFRDILADYCDKMKEEEKNATITDTGSQSQNK